MLRIRPARTSDLEALFDFAERVGSGMTTLPADRPALEQKIAVSVDSFSGRGPKAGGAYVLLLEDTEHGAIHGSAAVYPHAGADFGFFSYKLARLQHRSDTLGINRQIPALNLVNDLTGWTEVGSLVVAPQGRRGGFGRRLARSRYLLIAQFSDLFGDDVFAEMRGWQDETGRSPFWTAVGQRFFDLEFSAADRLSALEGSRFIQEMMPKHPIYLQLLSEEARACVGRPHASSRAAMELLLKEGFRYEGYVDVFDAGPQVHARRTEIATVRNSRIMAVLKGVPDASAEEALASGVDLSNFLIGWGPARVKDKGVILSDGLRRALEVADGDMVRVFVEPPDGQPGV